MYSVGLLGLNAILKTSLPKPSSLQLSTAMRTTSAMRISVFSPAQARVPRFLRSRSELAVAILAVGLVAAGCYADTASPATGLVVTVENGDQDEYVITIVDSATDGPSARFRSWSSPARTSGMIHVDTRGSVEILVTRGCDAIASWSVEPGRTQIRIASGQADLETPPASGGGAVLQSVTPCPHEGP